MTNRPTLRQLASELDRLRKRVEDAGQIRPAVKKLRVSALAERDLDGIWHYFAINSRSIEIANRIVDAITGRISLLAHTSEGGTRREEIEAGLRGFPAGDYRASRAHVIIARVIHGSRDQK